MIEQDAKVRRWPMWVGLAVIIFFALSLRPTYVLRPDPPQAFLDRIPPQQGVDMIAMGQRYWDRARVVRWKYEYGTALPEVPPEEFRPAAETGVPERDADELRKAYWSNLQRLWLSPELWDKRYTVDFYWAPRLLDSIVTAIVNAVRRNWPG